MKLGDTVTITGTIVGLHADAPEQFITDGAQAPQVASGPTRVEIAAHQIDVSETSEVIVIVRAPVIDVELS